MESKYPCERSEERSFSLALELLCALGRGDLAEKALHEGARTFIDIPMDYREPCTNAFRDAYWASEMFSKTPWKLPGVNRAEAAYQKFWQAEEACKSVNSRLVDWSNRASLNVPAFRRARQLVTSVLGKFSWDDCYAHFSFGPGATTSLPRRRSQRPNKWLGGHITENCLPLYLAFCRYNKDWQSVPVTLVAGNKVTTVPKSATTDRVIAIEPDWNMFFQRGLGGLIRYRLRKRCGLLKPNSQELHKELARIGSLDGSLATLDLRAASDSVSLSLVEALCPDDWVSAFYTCRSPQGVIQEKTITYEKISSMGNGFTFELETLLFWALARACIEQSDTLSVYGDDIIVTADKAAAVTELLTQAGMTLNEKKSFVEGPFRESCGGHYHKGHEVTPPYFRKLLTPAVASKISHANLIRCRAAQRFGSALDGRFQHSWRDIARQVPRRFYGPESLGDACLHMSFAETRPRRLPRNSKRMDHWALFREHPEDPGVRMVVKRGQKPYYNGHYVVEGLLNIRPDEEAHHLGGLYSSLWGVVTEESHYKTSSGLYRTGSMSVERWEDPKPWLDFDLCG